MSTRHLAEYVAISALGVAAAILGGCGGSTTGDPGGSSGNQTKPKPKVNPDATRPDGSKACESVDFTRIPVPPADGEPGWIDNFEDNDRKTATRLIGGWYLATDGLGNITIIAGVDGDRSDTGGNAYDSASLTGLHLAGTLGDDPRDGDHWGVNWQYEWPGGDGNYGEDPETGQPRTSRAYFDWSEFAGLVVWGRWGGREGSQKYMSIQVPTLKTAPKSAGGDGTCVDEKSDASATGTGKCFGHLTKDIAVTDCWRPYIIPFADLTPAFTPGADYFDAKHVFGIELAFSSSSVTAAKTYWPADIWVDDIYLYKNE